MGMAWATLPTDVCWALSMSMSGSGLSLARIARPRPGKAWPLATVSLAFLPALRAHKGKVETFLKKSFIKKLLRSLRSAPGAHVRFSFAQARRSAAALWRELPGVQPPRTCAGGSMSTSDSELPGGAN